MVRPFEASNTEFTHSIALDSSTVASRTTVTVAVSSTRAEELNILDSFYEHRGELDFRPFLDKGNDLDQETSSQFLESIIEANSGHLNAFSHIYEGTASTHQVEAVHSALLVRELLAEIDDADPPLVLLDGNEQKGIPFVDALTALGEEVPATAHCLRAETYYPTTLLADLTATYLAKTIDTERYDYADPLLRTPQASQTVEDWGRAYSGLYGSESEYVPAELRARRGDSVRERIRCWYDGAVAPDDGADRPTTDSITPIARQLRELGYDRVATILSGV